ncbi:hypothetical protein, partial [Ruegeria halocynthiae]|uniref:hypothetical protein n=1 Tax=Ruegeria halocynthiae TaxID=985054 RepID=UPI00056A7E32
MTFTIRNLDVVSDLSKVEAFYAAAPDYWETAEGNPPGFDKAKEFFEDIPPNCDPKQVHRLGHFSGGVESG